MRKNKVRCECLDLKRCEENIILQAQLAGTSADGHKVRSRVCGLHNIV